jgi:hypothetical protein
VRSRPSTSCTTELERFKEDHCLPPIADLSISWSKSNGLRSPVSSTDGESDEDEQCFYSSIIPGVYSIPSNSHNDYF